MSPVGCGISIRRLAWQPPRPASAGAKRLISRQNLTDCPKGQHLPTVLKKYYTFSPTILRCKDTSLFCDSYLHPCCSQQKPECCRLEKFRVTSRALLRTRQNILTLRLPKRGECVCIYLIIYVWYEKNIKQLSLNLLKLHHWDQKTLNVGKKLSCVKLSILHEKLLLCYLRKYMYKCVFALIFEVGISA